MMKLKFWAATFAAAAVLSACGGGGSSAGSAPFGSGSGSGTTGGSNSSGTVTTNSLGTLVLSMNPTDSQISASSPGTITAIVKDANNVPIPNVIVRFTTDDTSLVAVSPASVLVSSVSGQSQAKTTVTPINPSGNGAATITARITLPAGELTARIPVSVTPTTVTLGGVTLGSNAIAAYASTVVNFSLTGVTAAVPATVTVSSTCVAAGKASLSPTSVLLTENTGSVTYQDKGCGTTDQISVQLSGTAQKSTASLAVAGPSTRGVEFVSSQYANICLFGSGCPAQSILTFKVADEFGQAKPGVKVFFTLDQQDSASLTATDGSTDSGGTVQVSVASKRVPGPVRVTASVKDANGAVIFSTVSSALSVNSGLPRQSGFDLSASKYALNANLSGDSSSLVVILNDRQGNPVPDGTTVNFSAEGGTVIPASCQTLSSSCTVKFVVSNPRPTDGRVELVAYALGEEDFTDVNSDNLYTPGTDIFDASNDLGPVVRDDNENATVDANERIVGNAKDAQWTGGANVYVRQNARFFFSITAQAPRLFMWDGTAGRCSDTPYTTTAVHPTQNNTRVSVELCVRDANTAADAMTNPDGSHGNPIASGSALSVTTNAKGVSVSVDGSPVSATPNAPTRHVVSVLLTDATLGVQAPGAVDLTVTMPNDTKYTFLGVLTVN